MFANAAASVEVWVAVIAEMAQTGQAGMMSVLKSIKCFKILFLSINGQISENTPL
jgi:hypothetical protein